MALQGRSISSMMMLANIKRRVVVPCAPTMGNMLFASDAPDWIEAMAIRSRPTGNSVDTRLREDCVIAGYAWAISV